MDIERIWLNPEAEALFHRHQRMIDDIRASCSVPSVNATATQMALLSIPEERRKMQVRMELELRPFAEAMADLAKRYAVPSAIITEEREND